MDLKLSKPVLHVDNAVWLQESGSWQTLNGGAVVPLENHLHQQPVWACVRGNIKIFQGDINAKLVLQRDTENSYYPLPVTFKGTLLEVFYIPIGTTSISLHLFKGKGQFVVGELKLEYLSVWKAYWRMIRRVGLYMIRSRAVERRQAGVSLYMFLRSINTCYKRVGELRAYAPELTFAQWQQRFMQLSGSDCRLISNKSSTLAKQLTWKIIVYQSQTAKLSDFLLTVTSLRQSIWPSPINITLMISDEGIFDALALQLTKDSDITLLKSAEGSNDLLVGGPVNCWCWFIRAGIAVEPHALYWFSDQIAKNPLSKAIYSDHLEIDDNGTFLPKFKPDWNIEFERSTHYVGDVVVISFDEIERHALNFSKIHGQHLMLNCIEWFSIEQVLHIPSILWRESVGNEPLFLSEILLSEHLLRQGVEASVSKELPQVINLKYLISKPEPLVSVIIPTRDMPDVLNACLTSLLALTTYAHFEVLIVDNGSVLAETAALFSQFEEDPRVKVLSYNLPFNYSAINNFAVNHAKGSIICLLNNDTEIITPDWLDVMVGQLQQPDVGVVGCKLFFSDGTVQHAGDAVGPGGCADHFHSGLEGDAPGYMYRAQATMDLSAVTAACLVTFKSLFNELGGLNQKNLSVAFNDVDYCLRVRKAGYRVVYSPLAKLYHHESISRGKDDNPVKQRRARSEVDYMRQVWSKQLEADPFYNPNLSYARPDFRLSAAPKVDKPWL